MTPYKITIGLEIHVALKTASKLFSRSACHFDSSHFAYFDAAIPGVMPLLSREPVELALKFAHSVGAKIPEVSLFERKHYFYPDLPLGYQITQQHHPIMIGGYVPIDVDGERLHVEIEHAHLECDAAKSLHDKFNNYTALDLSRGSTPLLEIVSTPCMHSIKAAKLYAQTVCDLVKFLGICDGKLEEGSFRVDASISLSKTERLGTRVEIKNISSFGFLEAALAYEVERQTECLDDGMAIDMETRLFDEQSLTTKSMRKKETVQEYRYMPDPDIPPLVLSQDYIDHIGEDRRTEYFLIKEEIKRLGEQFDIKFDNIASLLESQLADLWLAVLSNNAYHTERTIRLLAFWIPETLARSDAACRKVSMDEVIKLDQCGLAAQQCKEAFSKWLESNEGEGIDQFIPKLMSSDEIEKTVSEILSEYPDQVAQFRNGQTKLFQFLIGKCMAKTRGKADPSTIKATLERQLG